MWNARLGKHSRCVLWPQWSLKPAQHIVSTSTNPHQTRLTQEMKATHTFAQRQANVRLRELEHGFNPITGAEFNKGTGR